MSTSAIALLPFLLIIAVILAMGIRIRKLAKREVHRLQDVELFYHKDGAHPSMSTPEIYRMVCKKYWQEHGCIPDFPGLEHDRLRLIAMDDHLNVALQQRAMQEREKFNKWQTRRASDRVREV